MALASSIKKDLLWRLADPMSLVMWIGVPLLIGGLMSLVFGGDKGVTPKARLLVTNNDDSWVSELAVGVAGGMGGEFLDLEVVNLAEGKKRIDGGDGSAHFVIPAGFFEAALRDTPTELELVTNPSQRILPKILQDGLEMFVEAGFYAQKLGGDVLNQIMQSPPPGQSLFRDAKIAAIGISVNKRLRTLQELLLPPVLTVEDELTETQKVDDAPTFNFGLMLFPGILFMSMMFMAQGMSYDVWREKDQGTLARLMCSPTGAVTFLLAKTIAGTVAMAGVTIAGLAIGVAAFGFSLSTLPGAFLWNAFSGACMFILFLAIQMLASSSRGANVMATAILFPLMMIGGTFFPFDALPNWMADIGRLTPNGIAVTQLSNILTEQVELQPMLIAAAELGAITALLFFFATRRLNGRFSTN
jgi:ABC-type multidrug transport system permease subunit